MSFKNANKRSVPRHTTESRATAGRLERGAERITRRAGREEIEEQLPFDIDADVVPYCAVCGGPAELLGTLGRTTHYRCRDCGGESFDTFI